MTVKDGMWVGKNRGDTTLPIYTYIAGTKSYTKYDSSMHKFYFIWPFPEVVDVDNKPTVGVVAYPTSYTFRQREKFLKGKGWYNSGPIVEKNCLLFAKKEAPDKFGMKANSPIKIALTFDGRFFIWIDKGDENKTEEQFEMILNILETVIN